MKLPGGEVSGGLATIRTISTALYFFSPVFI